MTNKQRCELWTEQQIAKAVGYCATTFHGFPQGYEMRYAETLDEARKHKAIMLEENKVNNYKRGVVIYAYTEINDIIFVE